MTVTTVSGQTQTIELEEALVTAPGFDEDADGIAGADELVLGTDPAVWDTDGDSFGDGDEWKVETDPTIPDGELAAGTLVLDGNPDLQILGMDGGQLILFYTGPATKSLGIAAGTKLVTASTIPVVPAKKGVKSFTDDALGFLGEVVAVDLASIAEGEAIVVDGVIYLDEARTDGIVYTLSTEVRPLPGVFSELETSWTSRFSFSTDDPWLFPDGSPLRDREIYNQGGLVVKITDGVISFSPDLYLYLLIEGGELADAVIKTTGVLFINLDVEATVTQSYSCDSGDILLAQAIIPIGDLPIKVDLELNAQLLAEFNATATAAAGFDSVTTVTVGGRYYLDELQNLSSIELSNSLHTPAFTTEGDASATLLVKPKLDIVLYEQAGAYLELRPYAMLSGHYPCPPNPSFDVGIDAEVGVYASFFGLFGTNPSITWPNPPLNYTIWTPETCGFVGTPPTASFTASAATGNTPLTVQFTDQSTPGSASHISDWRWNFGDVGTSTSSNPTHTYNSPGVYDVSLSVESESGTDTLTRYDYIEVGQSTQPPTAYFTASPTSGDAPLTVQFTDLSSAGTAPITWWGWDFDGNGTTDSNVQSPNYTYYTPYNYTVTLQVYSDDGNDATTQYGLIRIPSGPPPTMVPIPSGTFEMGDPWAEGDDRELPVHDMTLSAYEMGEYEVTNQEYADILNWANVRGYLTTASSRTASAFGQQLLDVRSGDCQIRWTGLRFVAETRDTLSYAHYPVVEVSWYGAAAYCNWLSESQGLQPCYDTSNWTCDFTKNGYHLPTEAQWERAAAWSTSDGGRHYRYGSGSDSISCASVNHFNGLSYCNPLGLSYYPYTSPVGYYPGSTSPTGCYDMSGNVYEWCNDRWYRAYTSGPVTDPLGPATGPYRLIRGGAWSNDAGRARSASRVTCDPSVPNNHRGFRVARTP